MDSEAVPKVAANNLFPIKNAPVFSLFFFFYDSVQLRNYFLKSTASPVSWLYERTTPDPLNKKKKQIKCSLNLGIKKRKTWPT